MPLTIGAVARAVGVNVQTIRYYERRGLLLAERRTRAGYRHYGSDAIVRLRFIRHAQVLGFSLAEIKDLLELRVRRGSPCAPIRARALSKIADVERRLQDLKRIKRTLEQLADSCARRRATDECPILDALDAADVAK